MFVEGSEVLAEEAEALNKYSPTGSRWQVQVDKQREEAQKIA